MPYPGTAFPIPPFQWPHVGRQWPLYNVESDQAEGLVLWMPWGGGYPGSRHYADTVGGFVFTENGTPVWVADGERGWSLLFDDGSSEYLELGSAILTGAPVTESCWFNSDDVANNQVLIGIGSSGWGDYIDLIAAGASAGDPVELRVAQEGPATVATTTGYTANTWYHALGYTASATDHAAYINAGSKGTSSSSEIPAGLDTTTIGRFSPGALWYMSGRIADVRIYNRALTDVQVEQLYDPATRWELFQIPQRVWRLGVVAPPATIVPIAMHHYRSARI